MTDVDELLARLRKLEPIALDPEFARRTHERATMRARARPQKSRFASSVVFGTVLAYLGWALHFANALYH